MAEPPTELAIDILHHHYIRLDVGLSNFNETDLVDEAVGGHDIAAGRYVHVGPL
jgi:hypothetical protein